MQALIDSGNYEIGQLFKLQSPAQIHRYEGGAISIYLSSYVPEFISGISPFIVTYKGSDKVKSIKVSYYGSKRIWYSVDGAAPVLAPHQQWNFNIPPNPAPISTVYIWAASEFDYTAVDVTRSYFQLFPTPGTDVVSIDYSQVLVDGVATGTVGYPELTTLDISNQRNWTYFPAANDVNYDNSPKLATIIANDFVGGPKFHIYTIYIRNCALTTDAIYDMFSQMGNANTSCTIDVTGNPCDASGGGPAALAPPTDPAKDQAAIQALLTAKGYTLIVAGGAL
jgi:hypothetical protein